jgi:acetyltransferase-like isoleucine patch superfamily enzyme
MKRLIEHVLLALQFDRIVDRILWLQARVRLLRYEKAGVKINFVPQGGFDIQVAGDLKKFSIDPTSHLKSATFIECSGGVIIGRYFHVGRGLTIFSTNHNWKSSTHIPYDEVDIARPVVIEDFVWFGSNVTVLPGVTVGEGAIISGGSVLATDVPRCAIVRGNPATIIGQRDEALFDHLKQNGQYY